MSKRWSLGERSSGLLLHPTSLPGPHGCGDLGEEAHRFAEFLASAGQRCWQMLPTGPVPISGTPYDSPSAFAGNALFIGLGTLYEQGLLRRRDLSSVPPLSRAYVDYPATRRFRRARLESAFEVFAGRGGLERPDYADFRQQQRYWLDDYALFAALRQRTRRAWHRWDEDLRTRRSDAMRRARRDLAQAIEFERFLQFQFDRQWRALKRRCHALGIGLIGDLPLFVSHDSADVWAHPELFRLNRSGVPRVVTGVPPDAFSRTGQIWRHPHYDWPAHGRQKYRWWIARTARLLEQFDAVRIDHFLGFVRAWEIPAGSRTGRRGRWRRGPSAAIFEALRAALGPLPIIAEDLGLLTPTAEALRDRLGFPGMRVLQFGFGRADDYHQPHNFPRHSVVYTGTHDNDTSRGWWSALGRDSHERRRVTAYMNARTDSIHWDMIRLAQVSVSELALLPIQDVLGLGSEARMNVPGTTRGNWCWRAQRRDLSRARAARLRSLAVETGRV